MTPRTLSLRAVRTGPREGVFPRADKLNELRPEFVITVGTDPEELGTDVRVLKGQKEFNSFIEGFDMPFLPAGKS